VRVPRARMEDVAVNTERHTERGRTIRACGERGHGLRGRGLVSIAEFAPALTLLAGAGLVINKLLGKKV